MESATEKRTAEEAGLAKQDPQEKRQRSAAADGRVYFSYAQIHATISALKDKIREWKPDVMVAIGGGGFIPARMLRTVIKIPILAVSLELYDDNTKTANETVLKKQWFDETSGLGRLVRGNRVLVVDEVDDTRATLEHCVRELKEGNGAAAVAVVVVHNKLKPKKGKLPGDVTYFAGEDVADRWNCYPWDAEAYDHTVEEHEELARQCAAGITAATAAAK